MPVISRTILKVSKQMVLLLNTNIQYMRRRRFSASQMTGCYRATSHLIALRRARGASSNFQTQCGSVTCDLNVVVHENPH